MRRDAGLGRGESVYILGGLNTIRLAGGREGGGERGKKEKEDGI